MGDHEREAGLPFRPEAPAGSVLERAIRRSGFQRDEFLLWNIVPVQPPHNYLEGAPYEAEAVAWGLTQLDDIVARFHPRVILALGGVAFKALAGLSNILITRGYPVASRYPGIPCIGSLHPSFLRRGAMSYLGVLMHDIRLAVALSGCIYSSDTIPGKTVTFWSPVLWRDVDYDIPWPLPKPNEPCVPSDYNLYPTEAEAWDFLRDCRSDGSRIISYDIETPRSHVTKEDETDELEAREILSIQFSLAAETGIFMPWREPFIEVARRILVLSNPKAGANVWRFDDPRLAAAGCPVAGQRHDIRWAWKHLQPDLSGALQFITSFYAPGAGPWKHLDRSHPQFYGVRDVDMVIRCI